MTFAVIFAPLFIVGFVLMFLAFILMSPFMATVGMKGMLNLGGEK
jgi:hypothetical protein